MRFRLYREHGALNSRPIFDAFEQGLKSLGHEISNDGGIPVIWSVLWHGRMRANQKIYENNIPIVIIEVGNLRRGITWRISLNHINQLGEFSNDVNLDHERPGKLGVKLSPEKENRNSEILIATQHQHSQQWAGQPTMPDWIDQTVGKIRQHSDRKIIVRSHPRSPILSKISGVEIEIPKKVQGTYDDFDINYNYHCVVNHNSGPAVQAAIAGIPVVCDSTSLAGEISGKFEEIEIIKLPPRDEWFLKLCHTEWTIEEIAKGIPQSRLFAKIS
jgi:hypothetical protein